jgi:hypothetical protein
VRFFIANGGDVLKMLHIMIQKIELIMSQNPSKSQCVLLEIFDPKDYRLDCNL